MFRNLKLGTQIKLGFGTVNVLLVIISIVAYLGLTTALDGFVEYRRLASNSNLVSQLQVEMLMMRLNVRDYLFSHSDKSLEQYQDYSASMNTFLDQAKEQLKNPQRAALIAKIDKNAKDYETAVVQVANLTKQRNSLIAEQLEPNGVTMRKALTEMIGLAHDNKDTEQFFFVAQLQEPLLLGRLYVAKFLNSNAREDFDRAIEEMRKVDQAEAELMRNLANPKARALFEQFEGAHNKYVAAMQAVFQAIEQRNGVIKNTLEQLGPEIAKWSVS